MPRFVALFGSINVGQNRLAMTDLRAAFEAEGFSNVETVVASGNVLFDHSAPSDEELEKHLALMMHDRFGIDSVALVRSRDALVAAIAENPWAADGQEQLVHTLFLDGPVDPSGYARLEADSTGPERLALGDRALHIDYVAGAGTSKMVGAFIERRLVRRGTARNLRSMRRILAKMDES